MPEPRSTQSATSAEGGQGEYRLGERLAAAAKNTSLGLGVLYVLGALSLLNQLRGGGVPITEAFARIPLEEHMTRGVGLLFSRTGVVLAVLLIASIFLFEEHARRRHAKTSDEGAEAPAGIRRWVSTHARLSITLLVIAYAALLVFRPVLIAQQLVGMTVAFVALSAVSHFARGAPLAASTRVLVMMLGVSTGFIARGYVFPPPLPLAEVRVENAPTVRGQYISIVDNAWYVSPRHGVIEGAGDRFLVTGRITMRERPEDWLRQSLPELLAR